MKNKISAINYQKIKRKFSEKSFLKNVITLASGTVAAQAIVILFSPIITRLYGPEAFGVLGVFASVTTVASTVVALTYPIAIVLPKKDVEAKSIVKLSIYISLFIVFLTLLILLLLGSQIATLLRIESIEPYLYLIPIVMLFLAGRQISEQWLIRKKQFKVTARVTFLQSLIVNSSKAGMGLIYPVSATLIFIATIGNGIHMLMLILGAKKATEKNFNQSPEFQKVNTSMKNLANEYSNFPKYRAPQVFITAITQSMPILLLTSLFGPASAGFYAIGKRVLALPSQLIGTAVADVFYPRIAEAAHNKEKLSTLLNKATFAMLAVGIVPFGVVIIFAPPLFAFIFGAEWETAGVYARWIALWSYALFVCKPSDKTLSVLLAQRFHLNFTIINTLIRAGALFIGAVYFNSDVAAVALFGISGALLSVILIAITSQKCKTYDNNQN